MTKRDAALALKALKAKEVTKEEKVVAKNALRRKRRASRAREKQLRRERRAARQALLDREKPPTPKPVNKTSNERLWPGSLRGLLCTVPGCGRPMKAIGLCQRCYGRKWAKEHAEERERSTREFYLRNPGYVKRASRKAHLKRTYGPEWAEAALARLELRDAIKEKENAEASQGS